MQIMACTWNYSDQKEKLMKRLWMVAGAAGVLATANVFGAYDGTISLAYDPTKYSDGTDGGGEFQATATGLLQNIGQASFRTFCIEDNDYFTPNGTYYHKINSGAVFGGVGYQPTAGASSSFDPISIGTAYLYSQFRAGTLTGYSYAPSSTEIASATALQRAIWWMENEGTSANRRFCRTLT
jgi:hypothetical protein